MNTISLDGLNEKAAMLERLDNKYILPASSFRPALMKFSEHFDVLEIEGKRAFTYATKYYDDPELRGYYDHHQGRRKRCKVRVREYVDAGFSFLEVKLKDKRKVTVKKRLKVMDPANPLSAEAVDFIEDQYRGIYAEAFGKSLHFVIAMNYERITLVAKDGGERMTIDTSLQFEANDVVRTVQPDMFIIETKSARGNGIADKILRSHHLHPTKSCSKYCIGMASTGSVSRRNRFLPALKRLRLTDAQIA
ncbi:polyphosphate polymerase domain-containing protein [Octadecabacter sp. G9-8]|uniref:Polyphosphate polymerase domain-containing protein n=1 Tax=Octadecabacter dasysiphoniae TaxID=2909341 RepID=A0ABS9CW83_9RHOB|nr:polyphosphate polymerase domain-containing protein [Octadecabacter dasysiphoniae]MCF2870645.1 polyphosphate polymerase domain-containing protein [Octadecabacter dasysiphoniae]